MKLDIEEVSLKKYGRIVEYVWNMHGISVDEVWMRYGSSYGFCMD